MKNVTYLLVLLLLLAGCSKRSDNPVIGFWKQDGPKDSYIQIVSNGEGYMATIYESNVSNNFKKREFPVTVESNTISIHTGPFPVSGLYNETDRVLVIAGRRRYSKVDENAALSHINDILASRKKAKELCEALQIEIKEKRKQITDADEWDRYLDDFETRKPDGCMIIGDERGF